MPPRRRTAASSSGTSPTLHSFLKLPLEIQHEIWRYTMHTVFVKVSWSPSCRSFVSPRKPPALLHCHRASRQFGLKTYQLCFASSPELARIYFSYEIDVVWFNWSTLGASPGRIGRKISDEELAKIQSLLLNEEVLLAHAEMNSMREFERFTNLEWIGCICDEETPSIGRMYGSEAMGEMGEKHLEPGLEKWPRLDCLRIHELDGECSRHWWFDGWNDRASIGMKEKWTAAFTDCFMLTFAGDDEDFFLNMLFGHGDFLSPLV